MKDLINLSHISPTRRKLALLGDEDRVNCIYTDCWINYPEVSSIRSAVRAVYEMPQKIQAQCILITGCPGMGKSSLFKRVESDMDNLRKRNEDRCGFISFTMSPDPTLRSFEESIGDSLGVPIGKIRNGLVPEALCRLAHLRSMRLVLIDEVHNLLHAGRSDQRKNLGFLRGLSSPPMSLSIIAFGVDDAAYAISSDAQLERRFQIYDLPRWKENESFRSFLAAYESFLPLRKPSELWRQDKVKMLLSTSDGITDAIVKRITRGAVWSIIDGKEEIDMECLTKAANIPPYFDRENNEGR